MKRTFTDLDTLHNALELSPLCAAVLRRPAAPGHSYTYLHVNLQFLRVLGGHAKDWEDQTAELYFSNGDSRERFFLPSEKATQWGYQVLLGGGPDQSLITLIGTEHLSYGGTEAVVAWFHDMSNRRQLEKTVIHGKSLLNCLIDSIPDFIYYKDPDGQYLGCNSAFETFIGRGELRGRSDSLMGIDHLFDTRSPLNHRQLDEQVLTTGTSLRQEEQWGDTKGKRPWVDILRTPYVGPDGSTLGMIGIGRDISLRKRDEQALQKAKEAAESTERYKIEFLAKISHELRTPLNAVMGLLQLMESTSLNELQLGYRDRAYKASRILQDIIESILDYAKIEANTSSLETIDFSLRGLVEIMLDTMTFDARHKGIDLQLEYDILAPELVKGDPVILRTTLSNLLSNAIKFTDKGSVTLTIVRREEDHTGYDMVFSVIDTGSGFDASQYEAFSQPFVQGINATTRQSMEGSGLGLAICRRLVRKMGSELQFESEVGQGSTFHFSTRLGKVSTNTDVHRDTARVDAATVQKVLSNQHLLLVEDNDLNREIIAELLSQRGVRVDQARNGHEAFRAIQERDYAAVLMDVQMPEMDGYQATRLIRTTVSKDKLPVIALTAHGMHEERQHCFEAGMNAFIRKPIERDDLLSVIAATIEATQSNVSPEPPAAQEKITEPAIDIHQFIHHMGNNSSHGWHFLRRFQDEYSDIASRLERLTESGASTTAWQLAHEFSSVAAIICAEKLAEHTRHLELSVRESNPAQTALALEELKRELATVMKQISNADSTRV